MFLFPTVNNSDFEANWMMIATWYQIPWFWSSDTDKVCEFSLLNKNCLNIIS